MNPKHRNRARLPGNPEVDNAGHPNTNYYKNQLNMLIDSTNKQTKKTKNYKDKYAPEVTDNRFIELNETKIK